ncbi:fat storage-inducing transmembrane protein 1-like [Solea senegalensis]|uniref:Fat storage-inducing transmembrane protein 1 homolog n=1 Tax=Solea senegalensis TaxID=28829 RepID=A0AAV6T4P2_SOLSE|nr:fat storage-inducing transmembrane protein 1 [Solea senegalensis]KAG7524384.1 fat storage-inducing transmembrane protein 1-like [Solea senegalensis]
MCSSCMSDSDKEGTSHTGAAVTFSQKTARQTQGHQKRNLSKSPEVSLRRQVDQRNMELKTGTSLNGLAQAGVTLEKLHNVARELTLPGKFILRVLDAALESGTNLLATVLGSQVVKGHFHLMLSVLVLFGPALSLWVSKFSIFANSHHYLYRKFLRSTWGWTWIFTASFILLLSLSARRSLSLSLRHLSRLGVVGLLWLGCQCLLTLLEDATGTCYEPMALAQGDAQSSTGVPLLLLHEEQTKASCLRANMMWRGYEVSQDVLILCLCCLLLVEELSVFGAHISKAKLQQESPGGPLRFIFLLCVTLLAVWMLLLLCLLAHFPKFPSQQLGGALGYLGWKGLYQCWYRLTPKWCFTCLPGDELVSSVDSGKPKH